MSDNLTQLDSTVSWIFDSSSDDDVVTEVVHARFETEPDAAVITVVETVASVTGQEPLEMPPLFESIDTEALDELVAASEARGKPVKVSFTYQDCLVTVSSRGDVVVERRTTDTPS
ncbi:HalOD1 output domain-containing protein [Natronobacterium texcoconense]|uniref:Halobacterial output domain-containing protein n=1 Tax=Natronobacterium texcoconense TaxID=1095778 RepID=A0A1H1ERW2_NATTX|nr:HalOD1 output domain-containing protein [Natronobacterium texcoconense]SDQ91495.1 hypothetical protein SAMN04489842_1678 [Natronobacterium texcoconense]